MAAKAALPQLQTVGVIEKDTNNDLIAWTFPSIEKELETIVKGRSGLLEKDGGGFVCPFRFSRFGQSWHYVLLTPVDQSKNPKVTAAAIFVVSQSYYPAKYEALLKVFAAAYLAEGSPLPIMQGYLSVFTTGKVSSPAGNFAESDFDVRRAFIAPVKHLFTTFGLEAVVIWVAVLCKKRIIVYGDKLTELIAAVRAFPALGAWHRQSWDHVRPFTGLGEAELKDLAATGVYIAGTTDPEAFNRKDLFDLFVNLPDKRFFIPEHAKESFILTKFHKTTAEGFLKLCEDEKEEQKVIKGIYAKTQELLDNLESLKTPHEDGSYITLEDLQKKKLPANADKFLFNVALAEGLTKR